MESIVEFLGVGGLIAASIALALGLEWVTLRALMHLMPGRAAQTTAVPQGTSPRRGLSAQWAAGRWAVPVRVATAASPVLARAIASGPTRVPAGRAALP